MRNSLMEPLLSQQSGPDARCIPARAQNGVAPILLKKSSPLTQRPVDNFMYPSLASST